MANSKIPAEHFVGTIATNVDNDKLSDANFREMIRNTILIVEFKDSEKIIKKHMKR